jgi:ketol-acid reductoisomerase
VCSKCPGSEVREEYKRGFVPTLIAVHPENDPNGEVLTSKSVCCTGGHKAGVLNSFVAE